MTNALPIMNKKQEIILSVDAFPVTVVSAETGSGKSTKVPQFLLEAGYDVVVTEPRRIAAISLAERVAEERGEYVGEVVGFATGFEKNYSDETSILYATDGLQLVRELNKRNESVKRALILDEVHEMNLNMEVLIAWAKSRLEGGWHTRLVIMSATLDTEEITRYFGKSSVNVVKAEGTLFDVSMKEEPKYSMENEIIEAVERNENCLVFLPGKAEIEQMKSFLSVQNAMVLPLHGELGYQEQKLCFKKYNVPKVILATNVAQTSITVPDIDTVIDSGLERRVETNNGIEGLFIRPCSKKDILQRKGRAGRTHEGTYILCSEYPFENRDEYGTPEIQRLSLEQLVLRLASVGLDAASLKFLHQPEPEAIERAKKLLVFLGALKEDGSLTDIGRKMSKMPVGAREARMLIEAEKEGCMEQMIVIAAIIQNGSLLTKRGNYSNILEDNDESSDLISELKLYEYIKKNAPVDFKELDLNGKTYFRVKEYVEKLSTIFAEEIRNDFGADSETLIKVAFSAMKDLVFFENGWSEFICSSNEAYRAKIAKNSNCYYYASIVFGFPRDIEINGRWGKEVLSLLTLCSKIDREQLLKWAPELSKCELGEVVLQQGYCGKYLTQKIIYSYNGYAYFSKNQEVDDPELLEKKIAEWDAEEAERQERVIRETCVKIGSQWYRVERYLGKLHVFIDKETLCNPSLPHEYFFDGRKVTLNYGGCWSENLDDLRNKVLKDALDSKIYSLVGTKERITGSKQIMEAIKTSCETTVTVELAGKTMSGKVYKYVDMDNKGTYLVVSANKVEVSEKVSEAIKAVFKAEAESKFNENAFFFVIKGKRELTNKGAKALGHYRDEKLMVLSQVTADSYADSMEYLELAYQEAIDMLG